MEIYFECTECKEVEPINITALSANGFGLQCSVCKTYFTFGVVAVEHTLAPDGLHCPVCQQVAGTYLACSYCHSEIAPAGKA